MSELMYVKPPEVLAGEINAIKDQVRSSMLAASIEIGQRLVMAKEVVEHGEWRGWLEHNVDYSERTAQNLMRVYQEYGTMANPQALADLSYTKAVALLGLPEDMRGEMIDSGAVAGMSTRALQQEIDRLRAEREERDAIVDEMRRAAKRDADAVAEANSKAEELRQAAMEAMTAANQARNELHEATKASRSDEDALSAAVRRRLEKRADAAEKRANDLALKVQKLEGAKPEIVQVEVVPDDVQEELGRLRAIASTAPCAEVVRLRDAYERFTAEFRGVSELLGQVEAAAPDEAIKYRRAVLVALGNMVRSVEDVVEAG